MEQLSGLRSRYQAALAALKALPVQEKRSPCDWSHEITRTHNQLASVRRRLWRAWDIAAEHGTDSSAAVQEADDASTELGQAERMIAGIEKGTARRQAFDAWLEGDD